VLLKKQSKTIGDEFLKAPVVMPGTWRLERASGKFFEQPGPIPHQLIRTKSNAPGAAWAGTAKPESLLPSRPQY